MRKIVGIRYIGKKDVQEDTVCNTGAVWTPGQVHNFSDALAVRLLEHTDSFEEVPASLDGRMFLTDRASANKPIEVAAYVNLTNMDAAQMALFARQEFNRIVSIDDKDEAQVRREVHALMMNNSIDLEAQRIVEESAIGGRVAVQYMATPEEVEALRAGLVVLAIIPAEVAQGTVESAAESPSVTGEISPVVDGAGENAPTLSELLESLDKTELLAFAKQEGVSVSNAATPEKLREKIFAEISARPKE